MGFYPEPAEYGKKRIWNPVFVLALILGLYVLALGRMPDLRRECGVWTWLFTLSMFVSAGVTVYYVCLTLCLPDARRVHELCVDWRSDCVVHEYLQNQVEEADDLPSMRAVLRVPDVWDFLRRLQ